MNWLSELTLHEDRLPDSFFEDAGANALNAEAHDTGVDIDFSALRDSFLFLQYQTQGNPYPKVVPGFPPDEPQIVVVDHNIEFDSEVHPFVLEAYPEANHRGEVIQELFGNFTSIYFDYDGTNLTAVASVLDEGSDWYVVNPGDVFGFASLESGQFTPIFTANDARGPVFVGTDEFYLGVSTDTGLPAPGRDVFGWVHLRNDNGELQMIENAVAYNSLGIIVGASTVIPEPSSIVLLGVGALGLMAYRRRTA